MQLNYQKPLLNPINNSLTKFKQTWALIIITIVWGIILYCYGLAIKGPFIFGDESTYFSFARAIHDGASLNTFTQYGPLYPALIAPFFFFKNVVFTYELTRILNILLLISTAIPGYWLAQELFTNNWLKKLFPYYLILTPFSGLIYLVWAEPLYMPIFYWASYLFCLFIKQPTLIKSILLSVFLSALYYIKPGAGLVVQIAAILTLITYLYINWQTHTKKIKLLISLVIFGCIIIDLPWILHYAKLGLSIIGYANATANFKWFEIHKGYVSLLFGILRSLFYQFSYFTVGTWGMFGLVIAYLLTLWQKLTNMEKYFTVFIILCCSGLIALSAIGMSSDTSLNYRMPNGRYFSALLPLITTLGLNFIFKISLDKRQLNVLIITLVITIIVAIIATPLYTRNPVAYNSMPDLSSFIFISDNGTVVWRALIESPTILMRLSIPLFFGLFALSVLLLRQHVITVKITCVILLIGVIFGTTVEHYYMNRVGRSVSDFNQIFYYLSKNNINMSKVGFDKSLTKSNAPFLTQFWTNTQPNYVERKVILNSTSNSTYNYFIVKDDLKLQKLYSAGKYTIYLNTN